jgi:hypothetical protein
MFAPMNEPKSAVNADGIQMLISVKPFLWYLNTATSVPMVDESLFVPKAKCAGNPANRYAGIEISPPPPAIASMKPAKNTSGQTIKNVISSNSTQTLLKISEIVAL